VEQTTTGAFFAVESTKWHNLLRGDEMENQRIRLSKTMLKNGLMKLLREKPLNKITIYELCDVAQINRTTFYKYYGSQNDLLADIEQDFLAELETGLKSVAAHKGDGLTSVLEQLYSQREVFQILVETLPPRQLATDMFRLPVVSEIFRNLMEARGLSEAEGKYIRQFVFQGTFAVLTDWLCSETPEPVSEIAAVLTFMKGKLYQEGINT
jgi:AcrR family transcriptional regulator